jgi:hypothetical protein
MGRESSTVQAPSHSMVDCLIKISHGAQDVAVLAMDHLGGEARLRGHGDGVAYAVILAPEEVEEDVLRGVGVPGAGIEGGKRGGLLGDARRELADKVGGGHGSDHRGQFLEFAIEKVILVGVHPEIQRPEKGYFVRLGEAQFGMSFAHKVNGDIDHEFAESDIKRLG